MTIPEYRGEETENYVPENKLTPEREAELTEHLKKCIEPYLFCPKCKELYLNIGYKKYVEILQTLPPEDLEDLTI